MSNSDATTLGYLSKEFGKTPSEYIDPDRAHLSDYQRYCLDGAILMRMRLQEKQSWDKARRESASKARKEKVANDPKDPDYDPYALGERSTMKIEGSMLKGGVLAGRVGYFDKDLAAKYVAAGGTLPRGAVMTHMKH